MKPLAGCYRSRSDALRWAKRPRHYREEIGSSPLPCWAAAPRSPPRSAGPVPEPCQLAPSRSSLGSPTAGRSPGERRRLRAGQSSAQLPAGDDALPALAQKPKGIRSLSATGLSSQLPPQPKSLAGLFCHQQRLLL